jgi:hypothetical protein
VGGSDETIGEALERVYSSRLARFQDLRRAMHDADLLIVSLGLQLAWGM